MNTIKIILLGDSSVGKSKICSVYFKNEKYSNDATVGIDFNFKNIVINNTEYRIHLWDTAGQERFRSIVRSYFRELDSTIIVFDINNYSTFNNIRSWIKDLEANSDNKLIFLIANKTDLETDKMITDDCITNLMNEYTNIKKFYKVSAKTDHNLINSLDDIIMETIKFNQYDTYYNINIIDDYTNNNSKVEKKNEENIEKKSRDYVNKTDVSDIYEVISPKNIDYYNNNTKIDYKKIKLNDNKNHEKSNCCRLN